MFKILVVEDNEPDFSDMELGLSNLAVVFWAETLEKGEACFRENPDVDLIIMDACVPGNEPNSMPLIASILASGYTKPIIAISGMANFSRMLVTAGATHEATKQGVVKMARDLLNL